MASNPLNRIDQLENNSKTTTIINTKLSEESEKIRTGIYILAWKDHKYILLLSLIAEGAIGITVVLFTSGIVYNCSLAVSIIYLVFKLLTAESKNFITYVKHINIALNEGTNGQSICSLIYKSIYLLLKLESAIVLDLVELDISCACKETISFATVDAIILIASINAASKTERVADAIPLLVGFDFIKDFPQKILKRFKYKDDDAIQVYEEYRTSITINRSNLLWNLQLPIVCMFHIIGGVLLLIILINSGTIELENYPLNGVKSESHNHI